MSGRDLVDVLIDDGAKLPPQLVELALEQLKCEPERVRAQLSELVRAIVACWVGRAPTLLEMELAIDVLDEHQQFAGPGSEKFDPADDAYTITRAPFVYIAGHFVKARCSNPAFKADIRAFFIHFVFAGRVMKHFHAPQLAAHLLDSK